MYKKFSSIVTALLLIAAFLALTGAQPARAMGPSVSPMSAGAFGKISPVDGASNQPLTVTLQWGASIGAVGYAYCIEQSFSASCVLDANWVGVGNTTSHVVGTLLAGTTYKWQVRALGSMLPWTYADAGYWSFTTLPNPPSNFSKSSPANGDKNVSLNPYLSWGASSGATSYEYCYDTTNDNACSGWVNNGNATSAQVPLLPYHLAQNTTYYWHVRAVNSGGTTYSDGNSSTAFWSFTTLTNHTVTFNANGGTGTMSPQTANAPTALNANTFTRTGYSFSNWNTAANGSGSSYADGATYSFAADVTLYAQWSVRNYTVTFNANGGSTPSPTSKIVTFGSAYGTLATTSRTGYSLDGWFTAASGGTEVTAATIVSTASDHTLYAHWTVIPSHTVTFNANGGTGTMTPQVSNVSASLTHNTFTRTGYGFSNWNTAANGSGTTYADGATYSFAADITLYAQWTVRTYTVTFDANGGSTPSPTSKIVTFGSAYGALAVTSRTGYTLAGWFTAASGGSQVTAATIVNTASDHTLYAQWTVPPNHTVTFNANGGTGTMTPQVSNVPAALSSNAFTRRGYAFSGWNTAANGSGTSYADRATYSFAADLALYAQWTAKTYTVTFDANGGSTPAPTSQTVTFGEAYGPLATTSRTNYILAGWFTAASGGTKVTAATIVSIASNHTLYAHWMAIHTLTLRSTASYDGTVMESAENSGVGWPTQLCSYCATVKLGDYVANQQFRAILSFQTNSLPANAVIIGVTLRIKNAGGDGANPYLTLGNIVVDVKKGAFSSNPALEARDFQAPASKNAVISIPNSPVNGWYSGALGLADSRAYLNRAGVTQFRLRFAIDDNNDHKVNDLRFYSGNRTVTVDQPSLVIRYYVP